MNGFDLMRVRGTTMDVREDRQILPVRPNDALEEGATFLLVDIVPLVKKRPEVQLVAMFIKAVQDI